MSRLSKALARAGLAVEIDEGAADRLRRFVELRTDWAKTHNLAGPQALAEPWRIDVVDGLAVAQVLEPELPLVDVGAGGGIPGLVVAALDPQRPVFLVEPRAKRTAFLRTAAHRLSLANVRVLRARWPLPDSIGPAQVVSRAVVSPEQWPALALRGGESVEGVIRMLAAERPLVTLPALEMQRWVDYGTDSDGHRRVEFWARQPQTT